MAASSKRRRTGRAGIRSARPSDEELAAKFLACAGRTLPHDAAERAVHMLRDIERLADVRVLTQALACAQAQPLT